MTTWTEVPDSPYVNDPSDFYGERHSIWSEGYMAAVAAYRASLPDPSQPIPGASHDVPTSAAAAREPNHRITWGDDRCQILRALYFAENGMTAAQVTEAMIREMSRNQVASRMLELRRMGLVEYLRDEAGAIVSRPTGPRAKGYVQRITSEGEARYRELRDRLGGGGGRSREPNHRLRGSRLRGRPVIGNSQR